MTVLCARQVLLSMVRRTAALLRSLASELAPGANPRPGLADGLLRQLRGEPAAGACCIMTTMPAALPNMPCSLAAGGGSTRMRRSMSYVSTMPPSMRPTGNVGAWQAMQRTMAARLALLGCMLAAALAVHSAVIYGPQGGVEDLRLGLVQVWRHCCMASTRCAIVCAVGLLLPHPPALSWNADS